MHSNCLILDDFFLPIIAFCWCIMRNCKCTSKSILYYKNEKKIIIPVSYRFFFACPSVVFCLFSLRSSTLIFMPSHLSITIKKILHFGEMISACVCLLDIILIKSVNKITKWKKNQQYKYICPSDIWIGIPWVKKKTQVFIYAAIYSVYKWEGN